MLGLFLSVADGRWVGKERLLNGGRGGRSNLFISVAERGESSARNVENEVIVLLRWCSA